MAAPANGSKAFAFIEQFMHEMHSEVDQSLTHAKQHLSSSLNKRLTEYKYSDDTSKVSAAQELVDKIATKCMQQIGESFELNFEKLELYVMRNIARLPDGLEEYLETWNGVVSSNNSNSNANSDENNNRQQTESLNAQPRDTSAFTNEQKESQLEQELSQMREQLAQLESQRQSFAQETQLLDGKLQQLNQLSSKLQFLEGFEQSTVAPLSKTVESVNELRELNKQMIALHETLDEQLTTCQDPIDKSSESLGPQFLKRSASNALNDLRQLRQRFKKASAVRS